MNKKKYKPGLLPDSKLTVGPPPDTLKQRAEKFRKKHSHDNNLAFDMDDLIAEIEWARENPPEMVDNWYWHSKEAKENGRLYWEAFADHLLACLGVEK